MNRCMRNTRAFGKKALLCLMALALAMMSVPLALLSQLQEAWAAQPGDKATSCTWVSETDEVLKWSDLEPSQYRFDLNQDTFSKSDSTFPDPFDITGVRSGGENNDDKMRVIYLTRAGKKGNEEPDDLELVFHPTKLFRGKKVNVTVQITHVKWDASWYDNDDDRLDANVGIACISDKSIDFGLTAREAGCDLNEDGSLKDNASSKMTYSAQKSIQIKVSVTYRSNGSDINDRLRVMVTDLDRPCDMYGSDSGSGGIDGYEGVIFGSKFGGSSSTGRYYVEKNRCELHSGIDPDDPDRIFFCSSNSLVENETNEREKAWERAGVMAIASSSMGAGMIFRQQANSSTLNIMPEPNAEEPDKTVGGTVDDDDLYTQSGDTFYFNIRQKIDKWQYSTFTIYDSFVFSDVIDDRCEISFVNVFHRGMDPEEIFNSKKDGMSNDCGTLSIDGQKVTWTFSSKWLKDTSNYNGKNIVVRIHVKTRDGVSRNEIIPNTGTVSINDISENTNEVEVPVVQPAPSITKTADAELYDVGDTATFTISFSQTEPKAHGDDIVVSDVIPDYFTFLDADDERLKTYEVAAPVLELSEGVEGGYVYDVETRTVTISVPRMEYGDTGTFTFTCLVEDFTKAEGWDGSYRYETTNVAVITMPNGDPTTAESEVPLTVVKPVLDVTKEADQPVYQIGDTATFTITVTQTTPDATAHNVVVTDPIPERFAYQKDATVTLSMAEEEPSEETTEEAASGESADDASADDAAATGAEAESAATSGNDADRYKISYDKGTATLTVTIDQLVYNETATIVFTCKARSIGKDYVYDTTNIVTASADNADPVDAPADVSIVRPELGIEKTASKDQVKAGKDVDFQIVVNETREGAIAKNVVITDTLPDGQHLKGNVKVTLSNDADYTTDVNGQTITVTVSYLAYGDTATIDYTVTIDESCDDVTLKNVVTATADHADKVQADAEIYVPDPPPATDGYDKTGDFLSRYLWLIIALGAVVIVCGGYGLYNRNRKTATARHYVPRHSASKKYVPRHAAPHKRTYKNR